MRLSRAFLTTLRENPRDADIVSHQLLSRGNMIRKHGAGIYSYLPMFVRSYHKLCTIVREELDAVGWQEVIMPFVVPAELWKESGRWFAYGKEMLRLKDRKDNEFCLGPTHEEVVTDLVRSQVSSYKQLPLSLYQITPKFRDEVRPRFGLMRGREFVMMDGYSFHPNVADLDKHYEEVAQAYENIFKRAGLKFCRVEADTGAIGGTGSHEYHVLAQSGEDAIFMCESCGYAANLEKAETPQPSKQKFDWGTVSTSTVEKVSTPTQKTIDEVGKFLNVPNHRNVKTLVYRFNRVSDEKKWTPVVCFVLGHRQLNEVKLKVALTQSGIDALEMSPLPEEQVDKLFNCPVGFLGPIGAPQGVPTFFDREILGAHDLISGANEKGFHLAHLEAQRDFSQMNSKNTVDLVNAIKGEPCPRCDKGVYQEYRGIEVGHIFKLMDKYSKPMNAVVQNDSKQNEVITMGTYGIGVTRVLAACIEQNYDADGMIWPEALAPYQLHLMNLSSNDPDAVKLTEQIYEIARKQKIEVLYDDRDLSAGVKFKDADLLGTPRRLIIGKKELEKNQVEFSLRRKKEKQFLPLAGRDEKSLQNLLHEALIKA